MADEKLTAATRIEKLLDNIAGGENEVTPATRLEKFLSYIADAMEGGGGSGGGSGDGGSDFISHYQYSVYNDQSVTINPNSTGLIAFSFLDSVVKDLYTGEEVFTGDLSSFKNDIKNHGFALNGFSPFNAIICVSSVDNYYENGLSLVVSNPTENAITVNSGQAFISFISNYLPDLGESIN